MKQTDVPAHLGQKMTEWAVTCGKTFQGFPDEVATLASFVEREMKGQELPGMHRDRDQFLAATFERLYPKMLASESCRQAVKAMMQERGAEQAFAHHDERSQYTIDKRLAEVLYVTGSALIGSILLVTAGESGGSVEERIKQ